MKRIERTEPAPTAPLIALGLTALEAQAYTFLLAKSPSTGYQVARGIGKPTANTYKALEALLQKGAIIRENGPVRQYRALGISDLLEGLARRHRELCAEAESSLKMMRGSDSDDRLYQLATPQQVFDTLRRMLKQTQSLILLDLFPTAVEVLAKDILMTARRSEVCLKVYAPVRLKGVRIIEERYATDTLQRWPGQWANGVVDGREYVLAFLADECRAVRQAYWSASPYVAMIYHQGLISEMTVSAVEQALTRQATIKQVATILHQFRRLLTADTSGTAAMRKRLFGAGQRDRT